jgi:phosphoglycerate dehydrogenase-like enzyme
MRLQGLYILDTEAYDLVYGPQERADIARLVDVIAPQQTRLSILENPHLLERVDVILSGWGAPVLAGDFLDRAPRLKGFFYGGGALGSVISPAVWDRGIALTSAIAANSIPVAEYALSNILFSLKHGWRLARQTREQRTFVDRNTAPGCYGTTVGLVSLGATARAVLRLLAPFDVRVLAYDPFLTVEEALELGVESVSLEELFRQSDVVSLHTPHLPETEGLITGDLFDSMKFGATFINTARAAIVEQDEMIGVANRRSDLQFVLDVAAPEPPPADSPLYTLPNVVLTPHIAGSVGAECRRMGRAMVEELERFVAGRPLRFAVSREDAANTSHRPLAGHDQQQPSVRSSAFAAAPSAG